MEGSLIKFYKNRQYTSIYYKHIRIFFIKISRVSCDPPSYVVGRLALGLSVANDVLVSLLDRDRICKYSC